MISGNHRLVKFGNPRFLPFGPLEIDRLHPLALGLVACYVPGLRIQDLCGNFPNLVPAAGGSIIGGPNGPALLCNLTGASSGASATVGTAITNFVSAAASAFWFGQSITTPAFGCPLFGVEANNTGASPFGVIYVATAASGNIQGVIDNQSNGFVSLTGAATPFSGSGDFRSAAVTWLSGGNISIYANGTSAATPISGGASTLKGYATSKFLIGQFDTGSGSTQSVASLGLLYSRELSAQEVARLHVEPFSMLRSVVKRSYLTPPPPIVTASAFAAVMA